MATDLRKLKEKATEAFAKGKFAKAAEFYADYCKADPKDLQARLRMGDAFSKAGNKPKAIDAYSSAAEGFAKEGFLPRAIAASKLILELDPAHKGVQQMLADLYARKTGGPGSGAAKRPAASSGASAVAMANEVPSPAGRHDAIELPPDTTDPQQPHLETTSTPMATQKDKRTIDLAPPPSPLNRKDAIELPPDDAAPSDSFVEAKAPPLAVAAPPPRPATEKAKPVAPPPPASTEEISLELEPAPAAAKASSGKKVYELSLDDTGAIDLSSELPPELQAGMAPTPATAATAIPIEVEPAAAAEVPIELESPKKLAEEEVPIEIETSKRPASDDRDVAIDLEGATPVEVPPQKASADELARALEAAKKKPEAPPPAAPEQRRADEDDSGAVVEFDFDTPTTTRPPPVAEPTLEVSFEPVPPPAEKPPVASAPPGLSPKPAAKPIAPAPTSRIWMPQPTGAEASSTAAAAPTPEGPTSPFATPTQRRVPRTDIESSLEALSRFSEIDEELQKPLPPAPPLQRKAPLAAKPPPESAPKPSNEPPSIAPAPPAAKQPPSKRMSFTELELEGDSLLHAVEAAAAVGQSQRGEEAGGEDVSYSIEETPSEAAIAGGELPKIPLFSDLPPDAFIELFERCPLRRFNDGDRIFDQGSVGDAFYVICAGAVRVFRMDGAQRKDLATLQEGTFFGEMALLSGSPRTASVEASGEETQLLEISAPVLTQLSHTYPQVAQALKKFMRQRLLSNVMNSSALFAPFNKSDRRMLVEKFRARDVQKGEVLIREGERSDGLYVVLSGEVEVKKGHQLLAHLKEGEVFGEMSLLQKSPATATVQASKRTSLLRLPRQQFDELVLSHPQILMLVAELTDTRKKETEALLSGKVKASEDGLMLV